MGEKKRREAAEAAAKEQLLKEIRSVPWEEHVQIVYDEIAALCQALGIPTPNMVRAGLQPGDPGTVLFQFRQLAAAVQQLQKIALVNEARTRALLVICKKLNPMQGPMFEAMFIQAGDLAEQQASDPDKQGGSSESGLVLPPH